MWDDDTSMNITWSERQLGRDTLYTWNCNILDSHTYHDTLDSHTYHDMADSHTYHDMSDSHTYHGMMEGDMRW